jgi:hypothetical protein
MIEQIADFLNIIIYENKYFFLNIWSIVHIISGILIMAFLLRIKYRLGSLFVLLVLWEVFEWYNYGVLENGRFLAESTLDIGYDVIYGMIGGILYLFSTKQDIN